MCPPGGKRDRECPGQRGQQEAAAVHAGMVGVSTVEIKGVVVVSTRDPRSALAVEPDQGPIDAAVQIAAQPVVREEGVQLGQQGHGPRALAQRGGVREGGAEVGEAAVHYSST